MNRDGHRRSGGDAEPNRTGLRVALAGVLRAAVALAAAFPSGCVTAAHPPDPDPGAYRAALALVEVDNRTTDTLVIAFRPAAGAGNEVVIGRAPPGERVLLAPVPAAEPIVLSARAGGRERVQLPARSFAVDERWLWIIQ